MDKSPDGKLNIVISSGHGLHVAGARDIIDEVSEARRVTDLCADMMKEMGLGVTVFHEDMARNQRDNVNNIVNAHNSHLREVDISVHFNSVDGGRRREGIGVETLYLHGHREAQALAIKISAAIAGAAGLRNRGAKPRKNVGFLRNSSAPIAILIEVCFVNSYQDIELYKAHFSGICRAIAETVAAQAKGGYVVAPRNLEALVRLGVINSVEYWKGVKHVRWLNYLMYSASRPGILDPRVDNGIGCLSVALEVLVDAGVVNTPEFWRELAQGGSVAHLDTLLINMANRARTVLERIIHAEARGEDLKGKVLVGNVIINRHNSAKFPSGFHNIVFEAGQFAPVDNGAYRAAIPSLSVKGAVDLILEGVDFSYGATFFRAKKGAEDSWHERALLRILDHGNHRFYACNN